MTDSSAPETIESPHHLEQQRRENREAIAALGVHPYGRRTDGLVSIQEARGRYDEQADQAWNDTPKEERGEDPRPRVRVAGRVVLKRDGGRLIWMQIRDHTSSPAPKEGEPEPAGFIKDLQLAISKRDCAAPGFDIAKHLDLGDLVIASGPLMRTKAGEVTIWADTLEMAAKSLAPPPEKWSGLQDVEQRYRRRYVDLYANPETMRTFATRARMLSRIREFLRDRGYLEVDTPVLQAMAGGAAARPFVTHMNALDVDLFMRIAPELYLKRLIVGGMPKVFEISRNFRNEGLDKSHNPEFTSLELYQAYGNYETMRELTEALVRDAAVHVGESRGLLPDGWTEGQPLRLPFNDLEIDYGTPFRLVTFAELFESACGFPMSDVNRAREEAKRRGLKHEGMDDILVVNELFEEVAEATIDPEKPTFVFDYPAALSPLTRPKIDDDGNAVCAGDIALAERWDIFIGGMEIGPAYTELNDPDVQESKFREQLAGIDDEESTFRSFDDDFISALKVGMPPTGGMGLGIDRLCMLLMNQRTIRDVILFPMMRPEA